MKRSKALDIYKALLLPRRIEERMLKLLRQNRISKWFSGIGQEAVAVGVTLASEKHDYILPMHRNLGVFTTRGVPFYELFCQLFGKADGFSKGRERSFHFGTLDHNIVGMISHLGAMMPVADGLALAKKLQGEQAVAFSFVGMEPPARATSTKPLIWLPSGNFRWCLSSRITGTDFPLLPASNMPANTSLIEQKAMESTAIISMGIMCWKLLTP